MVSALLAQPDFDSYNLSNCTTVMSGGDTVPAPLIEEAQPRFGSRFSTVYGQTELSPIVARTSPHDTLTDSSGTTGSPPWQVDVKITDPATGMVLPVGEAGEICPRLPG